jgi:hypothetical protein
MIRVKFVTCILYSAEEEEEDDEEEGGGGRGGKIKIGGGRDDVYIAIRE